VGLGLAPACLNWGKLETGACGDGFVGREEACDDGNRIAGDGCSDDCKIEPPFCGDGRVDSGEDCDDANGFDDDASVTIEARDTLSGIATLSTLWSELTSQGLQDSVTFASLNVFGRSLLRNAGGGRNHNQNHHVMTFFGKHVRGGVIGGVGRVDSDFGALQLSSTTGKAEPDGDVDPLSSLESAARTLASALRVPAERVDLRINGGKTVTAALR
jgi:cysteine-rich repeat protein